MHVRKTNGVVDRLLHFERLHTAAPALAGVASRTTTGRNVVSGGSARRPAAPAVAGDSLSDSIAGDRNRGRRALGRVGAVGLRSASRGRRVSDQRLGARLRWRAAARLACRWRRPRRSRRSRRRAPARATGSPRKTAACSRSATPTSSARSGATPLNQPIVGIAATTDRSAATGSSAATAVCSRSVTRDFFGSTAATQLNQPIVGDRGRVRRHGLLARRRATVACSPSATRRSSARSPAWSRHRRRRHRGDALG